MAKLMLTCEVAIHVHVSQDENSIGRRRDLEYPQKSHLIIISSNDPIIMMYAG